MLVKELHMMINTFDVFCNNLDHPSLMDYDTIQKRRNEIVSLVTKLAELESGFIFDSLNAEINYFKNERPKLIQYGIYYERLLNLETEKPIAKERRYYKEQEDCLHNDSKSIMEELKYYRLGSSEKDNIWFVKKSEKCDIFAVIKALLMLQKYLDNKLDSRPIEEKMSDSKKLKWTGTQAEYVEEILSWKETKVINDGDVTLIELFERFQLVFDAHITDFSGTAHDIINRHEPAKFCNKKAKALLEKQKRLHNKL